MTARLHRRVAGSDDAGATLVVVLVMVTVVAMVVTALLSFSDTSLRTTVAMRDQAAAAATADGAAQTAINALRLGTFDNAAGQQCFGSTGTLALSNLVPGTTGAAADSAAVRCTADPGTGETGAHAPVTPANKPRNAILTLSQNSGEVGLNIQANSPGLDLSVHGPIVSNSNIRVTNGALVSVGRVSAHTGCTGLIVSIPLPACHAETVADPNYSPDITTVPAWQPVPAAVAASCPHKVLTFAPGYYDDAAALSDLMSGGGDNPCRGSVWWFQPGTYYFDFQNPGSHQWLIKDGQLVAGTPTTSLLGLSKPVNPAIIPGACLHPLLSRTVKGVQFVFGGDSRVQFAGGADAEICGSYHSDRLPIAVFGLKNGTATPTTMNGASASTVTTDADAGFTPTSGTPASAVSAVDGNDDAYTAPGDGGTAHLTLSPFLTGPAVPAGSVVTSAKLRFVYGASDAAGDNNSRTVTVTPTDAAGEAGRALPAQTLPKSARADGSSQTVDVTGDLAPVVRTDGLSRLDVAYSTTLPGGHTERIDAVLLDLTYTAPALRGETTAAVPGNCLASAYTGASGNQCAVISTGPSYSGQLYVQGTVYTPVAPIDITLNLITQQVLRFGVISRVLWLKETGSISFSGPVIETPDDSPGSSPGSTVVFLEVFVCRNTSTCSIPSGAQPDLRARVSINDPTGSPVAGSRQMTILSWATRR